ncbi:S-DNA-T family DNA segregation ATPase FtsK/SpoIIIE [Catenulispora sp. GAS73]|uniref:type VII secretion protein EccCa n=1 Tax=Catenulispora sp. GAS73 TaxID=3156269 RepID=UPI003512D498
MTTRPFHRPARRPGPERPRGDLLLESPPELPETVAGNFGQLLVYLPMAAGGAAMVFMFAGPGGSMATYLAGGLYGMSTMGMMVGQLGRGSGEKKRRLEGERRDYLRYLSQARARIRATASRQREAAYWDSPDPDALWSLAMTSRLWERRATDPDFGNVRIAVGPQRLAMRLVAPDTKPLEDLDPIGAVALRSLIRAHAEVPELPVGVALRSYARIALRGDEVVARDLARALLSQLTTFHAPADLRIAVCTSRTRAAEWSWVKWLPHAQHPTLVDGAGPVRMVAEDLGDLEEMLGGDLADRPRFRPGGSGHPEAAQWVIVLDGGRVPPETQLAIGDAAGVMLLDLTGATSRDGDRNLLRLQADTDGVGLLRRGADGTDDVQPIGRPDRLSVDQAEALARVLARVRIGSGAALPQPLDATCDLPTLLGLYDLDSYDPEEFWRHRTARDRLRLPIGVGADGAPVELDIKESAQGGVGPHGLIIGATGSGKSELLRTLVLGLAVMHSSETLNFVLVDFKGGATFLGLERLAHTSALITNLSEELPLVARMEDALRGELVRRQELLRSAGNFTSVYDYERARAQGALLEPLPTLLVVVDEFSELLSTRPEFAELFVMIGRLGRSLGVHLLLASQRLEEGKLRGLETHLSYRICLRTFSAMESRMVIGVADAYELPGEPGHGFVKSDVSTLTRFKAAYVSGAHQRRSGSVMREAVRESRIVPFGTSWIDPAVPVAGAAASDPVASGSGSGSGSGSDARAPRMFDVLLDRIQGHGRPAHRVWLPPLDVPVTLGELVGPVVEDPEHGLLALDSPWRGTLCAPVGVEDRPFEQRRDPLVVDLSGAGGHVAIVGAPLSGKSTLLRTLISSLALTHTPAEVQFYCLDFGGSLGALEGLPHVGSVASRLRPEAVRRTVAEVSALVEGREAAFSLHGIDSMAAYRRAVREGSAVADGYGDVFLVVDGWNQLRQEYEALEQTITRLAARGLAYGVHVVVATNRWADIRQALKESLATRLELRLGEPFESEMSRQVAADVPAAMPGRGVTSDRLHFLAAMPRIDGRTDDEGVGEALRALVQASKAAWPGEVAPEVRLLPRELTPEGLFAGRPRDSETPGVALGLGEDDLAPVMVDFAVDPHFIVFGESTSGKSSVLRHLADSLVRGYEAEQARIVMVDYRRALLEAIGEPHLIAYAGSPTVAETTIRDLAQVLRGRLPGPEVSPAQLRERSWWSGADLYIVVDDYDLVATSAANPMLPLVELLPHSRDIGLHLIVARTSSGAARTMTDPVIRALRELATPGLLLSGGREDGPLIGTVSAVAQPPGRGILVRRNRANLLVQTPWRPPAG